MLTLTKVPRLKEKSFKFPLHRTGKFDQIAKQYPFISLIIAVHCINCVHSYKSDHTHQLWQDEEEDDSILYDVSQYLPFAH